MQQAAFIPLVAIVGPTASGKTSLGVAIAKRYNGEVVSADSMQIYTGMQIATAKPDAIQRQGILHHMMDFLDPQETYSVAQYAQRARNVICDIYKRGKLPVLVGGTGLYVHALLNHLEFAPGGEDPALRRELFARLEREGIDSLLLELAQFDPDSAERLAQTKNAKRIIRAIEIFKTTGITMTQHVARSMKNPSPYRDVRIGLTFRDRGNLYDRIDRRVDQMLEQGLLKEAEYILSQPCGKTARMAIGYKELKPYFDGVCTLQDATEKLKRETRKYAKRQLTWFKKDQSIRWIETDVCKNEEEVARTACSYIEQSGILQ